jgi:hypothetical protein
MRLLLLLLLNLFLFISCKKYSPADSAFFIKPSNVSVFIDDSLKSKQGSVSSKITDLWVYVNGQFQGAYPSDHLIPIVNKNANAKIEVFAGIKNNGIASTRVFWSFYNKLELDTLVESGKTIERPFIFNYNPYTVFAFKENFDGLGYNFINSAISSGTFVTASKEDSFEGKSLELELTGNADIGQIETNQSYALPAGSENVYLEFNYKCTEEFIVGLIGDGNPVYKPAIVINPQDSWNKIYVQLSLSVSSSPVSSKYKVYFRMAKKDGNPNPKLFLDNIKLVYL